MSFLFRNTFNNPSSQTESLYRNRVKNPWEEPPLAQPEQQEEKGFRDYIAELYKPGEAVTGYQQFLSQGAPREEDYERSKWAKLGSVLATGAMAYGGDPNAIEKGQQALRAPYERALNAYSTKAGVMKEAADVEHGISRNRIDQWKTGNDYEEAIRKAELDAKKYNLDVEKFGVDAANTQSLIDNRPLVPRFNDRTGNFEIVNQVSGDRNIIGDFGYSQAQKRLAEMEDFKTREETQFNYGNRLSANNSSRSRENSLALRQWDLEHPDPVNQAGMSPAALRTAANMGMAAVLNDPQFAALRDEFITFENGTYVINYPEGSDEKSGIIRGQIAAAQRLADVKAKQLSAVSGRSSGSRYQREQ